jgi:hypothetical protein
MTEDKTGLKFNYFFGLINLVVIFMIVWLLWYVFMNPDTGMKLYTPMYGFALVAVFVSSIILMTNLAECSSLYHRLVKNENPVAKGVILTIIAFLLMLVLNYIVFWGFLGKLGIAYFSPGSIVASGGTGAEPFAARENASIAILYYFTAFLWITLYWGLGLGRWPWKNDSYGVRVWSRIFTIIFFVNIVYVILFHPHVCYLFYPAQDKAGVEAWWAFSGTSSAFFGLGLVLCSLFWILSSDLLWEGYPWKMMEKDGEGTFAKGIVTFAATLVLGIVTVYILTRIMNIFWDEAFMGGQYTDGPDFRYIHTGEICGFFILATFILKHYFNNFPNLPSIWLRSIIRTIIAMAGGLLIYLFYYSPASTFFLAKVPGVAQPDDKPLVWTLLFLSIILIQSDFFDGWPLKRK